jgi:hypothetical protein
MLLSNAWAQNEVVPDFTKSTLNLICLARMIRSGLVRAVPIDGLKCHGNEWVKAASVQVIGALHLRDGHGVWPTARSRR